MCSSDLDAERKVNIPGKTGKVTANGVAGMKSGGVVKYVEGNVVDGDKPGPTNTKTGGVKLGNAGGYKKGGEAKKAYAAGGVVKSGAPVAMPRKEPSQPVSNDRQSGTFKKGGAVKMNGGGDPGDSVDLSKGAYDKSIGPSDAEMDIARTIRGIPRKLYKGAKNLLGGQGSVTDSERVKAGNKFSDLDAQGAITDAERRSVLEKKKGGRVCACQ